MIRLAILEFEFTPKHYPAGFTGRDVSTLSSAAKALHVRAQGDQRLADTLMELMEGLCGIAIPMIDPNSYVSLDYSFGIFRRYIKPFNLAQSSRHWWLRYLR